MVKLDVPEYYGFAAKNIDNIHQLIRDAVAENEQLRTRFAIDRCLNSYEYEGTLECLAAVQGLPNGDTFNDVVEHLMNRHLVSNQLALIWSAFDRVLPETSENRKKMTALILKTKRVLTHSYDEEFSA